MEPFWASQSSGSESFDRVVDFAEVEVEVATASEVWAAAEVSATFRPPFRRPSSGVR